ncbi:MAG: hypothetical protein V3W04_01410 [Gammaproteobacteria bacterium]
MSPKHEFIERMKTLLDEGKDELKDLESSARHLRSSSEDRYQRLLLDFHEKRLAAEKKLEDIEVAGEDVWDEIRDEAERTWSAFKTGLEAFRNYTDHS